MSKQIDVTTYNTTVEENIQLLKDYYAKWRRGKEAKKAAEDVVITLLQIRVPAIRIAEALKLEPSEITRIKRKYTKGGDLDL